MSVAVDLLRWYARHRRDLPWRRRKGAYAVWISEIMLQQTRVSAAIDYYRRFLTTFPNVKTLASADLDAVLKCWEGLGYYGRARNLHKAARIIVRDRRGRFPASAAEWRELPGIGRYSAGAIASIALNQPEPAVDGNVARILCRLFCIRSAISRPATIKRLWRLAGELLPGNRPGDFNQALMDMGSAICVPARPLCDECPLARHCQARLRSLQHRLPIRRRKKATPHYDVAIGVVWRGGRVLIDQRPNEGLLGGLWEFPGGRIEPGESPTQAAVREIREETGMHVTVLAPLTVVNHAYSHFSVTLHVFTCRYVAGRTRPPQSQACHWVAPHELAKYAFPSANRKILPLLQDVSNLSF